MKLFPEDGVSPTVVTAAEFSHAPDVNPILEIEPTNPPRTLRVVFLLVLEKSSKSQTWLPNKLAASLLPGSFAANVDEFVPAL